MGAGLPTERVTTFQQEEARAGVGAAIGKTWLQMPLYSARWNMLHRPSVWASMEQGKGFRWGGLFGMSTLLAGGSTMTYRGKEQSGKKGNWIFPARWINEGVGYGLQKGGRAISRSRYSSMMGNYMGSHMGGTMSVTPNFWSSLGKGMENVGTGWSKGGLGGAIAGLGGKATGIGKAIQKIGGGGYYDNLWGYGKLDMAFSKETLTNISNVMRPRDLQYGIMQSLMGGAPMGQATPGTLGYSMSRMSADEIGNLLTGMSPTIQSDLVGKARVRDIFMTNRGFASKVDKMRRAGNLTTEGAQALQAAEKTTGAVSRSMKFVAGAKLMKGVSVGANVVLIGGLLAAGGYKAITKSVDAMIRLEQFNGFRQMNLGTGAQPFMYSGALTERAKALVAISNSRLSARSAMGNEAALSHEYTG